MKSFRDILMIIVLTLVCNACKKYPENVGIHGGKPEKQIQGDYHITGYYVNDVDCMSYVSNQLNCALSDFQIIFRYDSHTNIIHTDIGEGFYKFENKKKELNISFSGLYYSGNGEKPYNFFISNGNWEILKLYKYKNTPRLKLKRWINSKKYEIELN